MDSEVIKGAESVTFHFGLCPHAFALTNYPIDPATPLHYPKPMKVSAQYAQEHFADLALAASNGEEVEIEVSGQPTLVLHQRSTPAPFKRTTPRILGEGVGEMVVPEWDEWKAIDQELAREVTDHPLIPGDL